MTSTVSCSLDERIESDIVFGLHPPGTRLVEDRLIERYGASRHVVRAALQELERRHLVLRMPNRGAEVVEMTPEEVDKIYEARTLIEGGAAELTPLPAPPEACDLIDDLIERHAAAWRAGEAREVFALNLALHRQQYLLCGNPIICEMIDDLARRVQAIRAVKYDDAAHMRLVVEQHRTIATALRNTDKAAYIAAVRAHLPASPVEYRRLYARRHGL